MRLIKAVTIAILSGISMISCTKKGKLKPKDTVRFEFAKDMLIDISHHEAGPSSRVVLQFTMPKNVEICDYYKWQYRFPQRITPETAEKFERTVESKIKALREDLPNYFCQPFFEGDELRLMSDLFSDRLEKIFDQIRADKELTEANVPMSSLFQTALFMTLPPLWIDGKYFDWHYPQELIPIIQNVKRYREGRELWKEALEKSKSDGLEYKGPVPVAVRQPVAILSQPFLGSLDGMPDDVWLRVLCMTGPYAWYARLVCRKWRSLCSPLAMVGVLGYKEAFRALSGRVTFDSLVLRLDSLAQLALKEFTRTSGTALDTDVAGPSSDLAAVGTSKWVGVVNGLREIIQAIDPYHVLAWYRDAWFRLAGLEKMIEFEVFALILDARDDVFASMILSHVLDSRTIGSRDLGWSRKNRNIGYRLIRAYAKKYPEAVRGHPPPAADSSKAWWDYRGL